MREILYTSQRQDRMDKRRKKKDKTHSLFRVENQKNFFKKEQNQNIKKMDKNGIIRSKCILFFVK